MSENMTIDMEKDQDNGQITYANEVISTIVSVATTEVDGISGIVGAGPISGIIGKSKTPRGVRVDMDGQDVNVDVSVTVDYGMPIQKVGRNAQENVRKSIESMTGLHVVRVDVHVQGVSFEKENSALSAGAEKAVLEAGAPAAPEKEPAPVEEKADEAPEQIADEPAPAPEAEPAQDGPEA